jgi:hypothetical protein
MLWTKFNYRLCFQNVFNTIKIWYKDTPLCIFSIFIGSGIPSLSRSIDLTTDPGLKSHWNTFSCSESTAASTKTFIWTIVQLIYSTNDITIKRRAPCLKAAQSLMIYRSLDQSRFKIASDYLNMFRLSVCIWKNLGSIRLLSVALNELSIFVNFITFIS